jgi:lysophospholipid acyltransferase (LPLAT)-like uncharacterized protein
MAGNNEEAGSSQRTVLQEFSPVVLFWHGNLLFVLFYEYKQ